MRRAARGFCEAAGVPVSFRALKNVQALWARQGAQAFLQSYKQHAEALVHQARLSINMVDHFAKEHPALLNQHSPAHLLGLEELFRLLEARGVPRGETRLLFFSVPNVLEFDRQFFAGRAALLQRLFGMGEAEVRDLLRWVPRVFFQDQQLLESKRKALAALLGDRDELVGQIVRKHPYLLLASSLTINGNLYTLLDFGFSGEEIGRVLLAFSHFLFKRKGNAADILRYLGTLGLGRGEARQCVLENPFLLSLNFGRMFMPKLELLRKNGFKGELLRDLVKNAPWVLTVSFAALTAKFQYLSRRHNLQLMLMPQFPRILFYSYDAFLKPRGDLMLSTQRPLWDKVLDISKEEFLLEVGAKEADLDRLLPAERRPEIDLEKMELDKHIHAALRAKIYAALG